MKEFRVQPEGDPRGKMPYPYFVGEDGFVGRQDVWKGNPTQVIGFAKSVDVQQVDLDWADAMQAPELATGMYLVAADANGDFATYTTPIATVTLVCE